MPINFPDSPTTGDTHTVGDKTWTYDGTAWNVVQNNISDHGNLDGLADDDHTQYLLADGTRTATELTVSGDLTVDTTTMHVDSTNNRVGIGTASPSFPLSVDIDAPATYGNAAGNFAQMWTNSGTNALGVSLGDNLGAGLITNNGYDLHLGTSGASRVTVQSGGNVGINDTTPSYTLDVNGDINATGDVRVAGNPVGMVLVKSQTIGSGVSSVTVTGAFSSTFDNYRILISGVTASVGGSVPRLQLGSTTGGYYSSMLISGYTGGAPTGLGYVGNNWYLNTGSTTTGSMSVTIDLYQPNLATATTFTSISTTNGSSTTASGLLTGTTQYTSFIYFPDSGTITGGTIRVYGYNNG